MEDKKRKYDTKGKANTQIQVNRSSLFMLKAIASIKNLSKDEAIDEAIKLFNAEHMELLK